MAEGTNPVPLGQVNTGSAVVLGPSGAVRDIAQVGRQVAIAGAMAQRNNALLQRQAMQDKQRLAADAAKFDINEDIWFPHQDEYLQKTKSALGTVAKLYDSGLAATPRGQLAINQIKTDLESYRIKSNQLKRLYAETEDWIEKNGTGTKPTINAELAKEKLKNLVYDKSGKPISPTQMNEASMLQQIYNDPTIYNDLPAFEKVLSAVEKNKAEIEQAGKRGGVAKAIEAWSNGPFELGADGLPIWRDDKGQVVNGLAPGAKISIDSQRLYDLTQKDPIAAAKVNQRALELYNQSTGKNLNTLPLNVADMDVAKLEQAKRQATMEKFGPLITTNYSFKERLNPLPRAPRVGAGNKEVAEVYTVNKNGLLRIGNQNYKAINIDNNANLEGGKGVRKTIVRPTSSLIDAETGKRYTSTQQFEAVTGGSSVVLKLNQDITVDGIKYKKGTLLNPTDAMQRSLQDVYNERPNLLEPVLVQTVSRTVPNENMAVFKLKSNYIDPVTKKEIKKDQTVNAVKGSNNYRDMLNNTAVFELLDEAKVKSTEPKTMYRELATWRKDKDGNSVVTPLQGQGGYLDKELKEKFKAAADEFFGSVETQAPTEEAVLDFTQYTQPAQPAQAQPQAPAKGKTTSKKGLMNRFR